ncbi:hypothetical protein PBY51_018565 [Eleginops maclovinus]|uniref:Uncharacterized protein n=1 Tax=Eleginops maclovinus TaxID=56733 RepID=A0AAN7Y3S4_ELEMC|nr:hypothetical protein PBY51_018565 [Eleginops maclovinus]
MNTRLVTELMVLPPASSPSHPAPYASRYVLCVAVTIVACRNISVIHLSVTSPSPPEHEGVTAERGEAGRRKARVIMGNPKDA